MKNRSLILKIFASLMFLITLSSSAVTITPDNPNIQYFGRWDWSAGNPKCTWPSLYLKARFSGTSITANFTNGNQIHVLYTIDGGDPVYVNNVTQINVTGLSAGEHEIMISRRVEDNGAELTFNGFEIPNGNILSPSDRPCLKFEFVGNSITCGLANENFSPTWDDGNGTWIASGWEQNSYRSYAPVLSRLMEAEYRVISHSGQGMYINLNNSLPEVKQSDEWELNSYYPGWAKPGWDNEWDFDADEWEPDVFFTLLGTNDWSDLNFNQGLITKADYKARYNQFIDLVFSKYPNTTFMVVTPLLDVRGWAQGTIALQELVAERQALGDEVYLADITNLLPNQTDYGNDWTHPTTKAHVEIANEIKSQMENVPGLMAELNSKVSACNVDCNGDLGGTAYLDDCDVCVEGNTGITSNCNKDCAGVDDGTAIIDSCGVCTEGTTGLVFNDDCTQDCAGVWGGLAQNEGCNGECTGGTTGLNPCGVGTCAKIEFDDASEYNSFVGSNTASNSISGGKWIITGNSTSTWDGVTVELNEPMDFTAQGVPSKKLFLRVKSSSKVMIQPSFMDGAGNIISNSSLGGWNSPSNEKLNWIEADNSWANYAIDFEGNFTNQFGCGCPIQENDITKVYIGINPGWGTQWPPSYKNGQVITSGFTGTIEIEYLYLADENCDNNVTSNIEVNNEENLPSAYPNPTQDAFKVNNFEGAYSFINLEGKIVESGMVFSNQNIGQNLSSGLYILILNDGIQTKRIKVIKQ